MGVLDLLQQYVNARPDQVTDDAADHFHEVAKTAPPETVGQGLAAAFRSDQTPLATCEAPRSRFTAPSIKAAAALAAPLPRLFVGEGTLLKCSV